MRLSPRPHDVLTPFQRQVLAATFGARAAQESFALGGGTGLAEYYAGHRHSADFDLFTTESEAIGDLAAQLPSALSPIARATPMRVHATSHRYLAQAPDGEAILIDLARADPPSLGDTQRVEGVNVLALDDIAVGKMLVLHDRVEVKDGIDLLALQRLGYSLAWLRRRALEKDPGLEDAPVSVVTNLLDLAGSQLPWPEMVIPLDEVTLKEFLERAADELAADIASAISD